MSILEIPGRALIDSEAIDSGHSGALIPTERDRSLSPSAASEPSPDFSVVIPLYNEEGSLEELHERLQAVLSEMGASYEILFVDDGSTDNSPAVLRSIAAADPHCRIFTFRRNIGKAAGLSVGFQHARGERVITMDADLQDEPSEIPRFLEAMEGGCDLVSGWKRKRHDPIGKTLPSRVFNWATRKMTGLDLHDFNCGFKMYRRGVVRHLNLYGELHRYVPALAFWKGYRVGEIPVEHHPRKHGYSKYGWERFVRGMFDLLTVVFLTRYVRKPLHFFGGIGLALSLVGVATCLYLTVIHFMGQHIYDRPLLILGVLFVIVGVQLVSTGLIAELIVSQRSFSNYDEFLVE